LQNLVYGKAILSHCTSSLENAHAFLWHAAGLGLSINRNNTYYIINA